MTKDTGKNNMKFSTFTTHAQYIIIYILIESFTIVTYTINSIHYSPTYSVIIDYTAISAFSARDAT